MLTKETKRTAEQMGQTLAPLFATAQKLGEKLQKAAAETRKAHSVATAWQYPAQKYYAEECGEDSEEIQKMRNENAHEWHEVLYKKYDIVSQKETAEKVARLNYRNYLAFISDTIAHLLHEGDTWAQFYEKKGMQSLREYLAPLCGKGQGLAITPDGTGWDAFGSPRFYCYYKITLWGVCGVGASNWGTYQENKKEQGREWTKPQEPKRYTLAQYIKLVKQLKKLENEAKAKAREHHEKARASGLIYSIGGLSDPVLNVWGKND